MCRTARTKQEKNSGRDFILIKAVTGFPAQPGHIAAAWAVHRGGKAERTARESENFVFHPTPPPRAAQNQEGMSAPSTKYAASDAMMDLRRSTDTARKYRVTSRAMAYPRSHCPVNAGRPFWSRF